MKTCFYIFIAILTSCISCKKLGLCHDKELSLIKVEFYGSNLRIDGYYYDINFYHDYSHLYIFFNTGIIMVPGSYKYNDLDSTMLNLINASYQLSITKYYWGLFYIKDDSIKIEHWLPAQCGYPVVLRTGIILNDTTILLTKLESRENQGIFRQDINQTLYFRHFSPKPDSINNFLN